MILCVFALAYAKDKEIKVEKTKVEDVKVKADKLEVVKVEEQRKEGSGGMFYIILNVARIKKGGDTHTRARTYT